MRNRSSAWRPDMAAAVTISSQHPVALAVVAAIHVGDLAAVRRLLAENPWLPTARLGDDDPEGMSRTLLHVVTDWPGHFPNGAATVAVLAGAGADVNARFRGPHEETPLHWAASTNDVEVLDALLDAGADIEAPGAVLGGGPPLADARGFKQWQAACRLVERGAETTLIDAATLGLADRVAEFFAAAGPSRFPVPLLRLWLLEPGFPTRSRRRTGGWHCSLCWRPCRRRAGQGCGWNPPSPRRCPANRRRRTARGCCPRLRGPVRTP